MLAAGADAPGVLLDSLGTAEALTMVRDRPLDRFRPWAGTGSTRVPSTPAGPSTTSSAACRRPRRSVEWFRGLHGGVDHATLIAEAEAAASETENVLFLPHLRLGSPPFPDPVARGAFLGLSSATGRGTLFRAVLEGIALDGGNMLKAMLGHLGAGPPERILAIGGSTRNQLLMRLKASVYGAPLAVMDLADTTCLGAALLGGMAAGLFADIEEARRGLAGARARRGARPGVERGPSPAPADDLRRGLRGAAPAARPAAGRLRRFLFASGGDGATVWAEDVPQTG